MAESQSIYSSCTITASHERRGVSVPNYEPIVKGMIPGWAPIFQYAFFFYFLEF